jgi:hypothetical protein
MPSGQGARHGMVKLGVRRNRLRRRTRILNAAAMSITDSLVQHRGVGTNHNVALMGNVTISQKNEVNTEETVHSAADEATHQNDDEVKALQEFKETKSVSAAGLKSKIEHKEHVDDVDADFCFLQSLVPDMKKLSDRKKLKFKELIISSIGRLLEED